MTFALSFALAVAALAPQAGSRSEPAEVKALHRYAYCITVEHRTDVRDLLATDFRDRRYAERMRKLVNRRSDCPGVEVPRAAYATGTLLWGGALAEAMLKADGTVDRLAADTGYRPELPVIEARNPGELMAFCVVRANADAAAGLLRSEPASPAEAQAIMAMSPTLGDCVPANSKSEFTRESLRSLIALGAYRLAAHNQGTAASAAGAAR